MQTAMVSLSLPRTLEHWNTWTTIAMSVVYSLIFFLWNTGTLGPPLQTAMASLSPTVALEHLDHHCNQCSVFPYLLSPWNTGTLGLPMQTAMAILSPPLALEHWNTWTTNTNSIG